MTTNEYLKKILQTQTLNEGSDELPVLQEQRAEVEKRIRSAFEKSTPTVRYGGSKAKGTMIREAYDLDIIAYFANNDTSAGETLEALPGSEYNPFLEDGTRPADEAAGLALAATTALESEEGEFNPFLADDEAGDEAGDDEAENPFVAVGASGAGDGEADTEASDADDAPAK